MIKWFFSSTIIIIALKIYNAYNNIQTKWFSFHYNERLDYFIRLNRRLKSGGIVFVGDSLIENYMLSEFFPDHYVINRGISGDTTCGILCRLKSSVYDLKPKKIFLLIGINDIGNEENLSDIIKNIRLIVSRIRRKLPDTKIYVQSIYPVRIDPNNKIKKRIVGKRSNKKINITNRELYKLCKKYNIQFININKKLKDKKGQLRYHYTQDGLHLSPLGYEIVSKELEKYM